jgi:hypothetical protein
VVLLLGGDLASWMLAMDERGGHQDLYGSGRQSVIPYIHGRMELYYSSLALPEPFLFLWPLNLLPARSFYYSRLDSYIETQAPTGGPEVVETLYSI